MLTSAISRAWRSLARASIFVRASTILRKRSSRRASSSGIDMPSGMAAASAASAEFGLTAAKGMAHLDPLLERIQADESLPVAARELFAVQAKEYAQLQAQIDEVEAKLKTWHKTDECSQRLVKIPGVGPIGAALLTMKTPAPELFRSGRQFAPGWA
jgi:transposase